MQDLLTMAEAFGEKRKRGEVQAHGSGFGGSGFKFDSAEDDAKRQERKVSGTELWSSHLCCWCA